MNQKKRWRKFFIIIAALGFLCWYGPELSARAEEPTVIVLDPGHGGENLGGQYESYTEKELNMVVARAMKEELEKYDNVVVYLTHENDVDMSIKDRALFAKDKSADFLFCLHFNMSVNHNLFGAEVWVPAFGDLYVKGYQFAEIEMKELTGIGLYSRGIKTKLNDKGENYYGILRYCSEFGVPSALIEHCHLDQENDQPFYQKGEEQLKQFGRLDADAAAKYLGLSSASLGVDYGDYKKADVERPSGAVKPDKTEPEVCRIEVASIDETTGEAVISMEASDSDSYILYYNYSLNGGNTYSKLESWPRPVWNQSEKQHTFTVTLPFDQEIELRANAYNGFDVWAESNIVTIPAIPAPEKKEKEETLSDEKEYEEITVIYEPLEEEKTEKSGRVFLLGGIFFILLIMILVIYSAVRMAFQARTHKKRRKRR